MLAAGFLAHQGHFRLGIVIAASALTTLTASHLYYEIARHGGRALLDRKIAAAPRLKKIVRWVEARGILLMLVARFLFGFRVAVPTVCGAIGMERGKFSLVNTAGAFFWASAFGSAGYFGAHALSVLMADLKHYEWPIAAAVLIAIAALILWRTKAMEVKELRTAVHSREEFISLSLNAVLSPEQFGNNPLAKWQHHQDAEAKDSDEAE